MSRTSFDDTAQNIAESIDDVISTVPRERERRIELTRHQVRRAPGLGYRAARKVDTPAEGDDRACGS
jgi:hypothetical protein